jgi:predicted ATP-binding protein involved in virulence
LHPQFTLLVGSNGVGKTTILDALAVGMGAWLYELGGKVPFLRSNLGRKLRISDGDFENRIAVSYLRKIQQKDTHLVPRRVADRVQFQEQLPVSVKVIGQIGEQQNLEWGQTDRHWDTSLDVSKSIQQFHDNNPPLDCPVLASYGLSRAMHPRFGDTSQPMSLSPVQRWDAYSDCFNERIDYDDLRAWFYRETAASGANSGRKRPGYEVVRGAVFGCVPDADDLWFDVDRADLVCSIGGQAQPLSNLSDGQRMLLAMVADIAIKVVTLNAHLLPSDELGLEDKPSPRVLQKTPGIVLIDELDLHLHPSWQRRVAADLKRTFPSIQFVCTSHSPQVIGEILPEQIRIIDGDLVYSPEHSFGVDSSRILEEIMDTPARNKFVGKLLTRLSRQISDDDFDGARSTLQEVVARIGENDPDITSARALMDFVEQPA